MEKVKIIFLFICCEAGHDAVEILLAMNLNTTKVNKHKADYYYQTLKPIILREFKNGIKPYNQTLYNLFVGKNKFHSILTM